MENWKNFYKFYGILTNHFPYKSFLKKQKSFAQRKLCRLEIDDLKIVKNCVSLEKKMSF